MNVNFEFIASGLMHALIDYHHANTTYNVAIIGFDLCTCTVHTGLPLQKNSSTKLAGCNSVTLATWRGEPSDSLYLNIPM